MRTKKLGETVEHQVTVDVKKIADGSPVLPHKQIKDRPAKDHFTIVEISKHNRAFHGRTLGRIKQFLSSMYRQDFRAAFDRHPLRRAWQTRGVVPDKLLAEMKLARAKKGQQRFQGKRAHYRLAGLPRIADFHHD